MACQHRVTGSSARRDLSSHGLGWLHTDPPCCAGVVLIPEGLVEHVHDVSTLIAGGWSWTHALQQTGSVLLSGLLQVQRYACKPTIKACDRYRLTRTGARRVE